MNANWSTGDVDIRASLKRAQEIMLKQSGLPEFRLKKIWATRAAHDQLVAWLNRNGLGPPSGIQRDIEQLYGLPVTIFKDRLEMLMQAWQHDLREVIAIATTPEGNLYQVNFGVGFDQ